MVSDGNWMRALVESCYGNPTVGGEWIWYGPVGKGRWCQYVEKVDDKHVFKDGKGELIHLTDEEFRAQMRPT